MVPDITAFLRENFALRPVPFVPEISLHTAHAGSGLRQLLERQAGQGEEALAPYWAYPWAGGMALARYILDHKEAVAGRRVADLGTGSGLVGIAAALAGASHVLAVDIDPLSLAMAKLNAAANGVRIAPELADLLDGPVPDVDVIVAGDLFYDAALGGRVLPFLARCRAAGREVLIGDPHRAPLPERALRPLAHYRVSDVGLGAQEATASAVFTLGASDT